MVGLGKIVRAIENALEETNGLTYQELWSVVGGKYRRWWDHRAQDNFDRTLEDMVDGDEIAIDRGRYYLLPEDSDDSSDEDSEKEELPSIDDLFTSPRQKEILASVRSMFPQ